MRELSTWDRLDRLDMRDEDAREAHGHRVAMYVDGFNLYYGLRSQGWRRFYIDMRALGQNMLRPGQRLVGVRYFTARVAGRDRGRQRRQGVFLEALETLAGVEIHYGHFLSKPRECRVCGARWTVFEEKMTDANIAVRLLGDAQDDVFDTAILVSADGDLAGPVEAVLSRYAGKRVVAVFPPGRRSDRLRQAASAVPSRSDWRPAHLHESVS